MVNEITNIKDIKDKTFRNTDWPSIAEERDIDESTEVFNDKMLMNIFEYDIIYIQDYNKSIEFIDRIKIPHNNKVVLTKNAGCRLCHNINVEDKVHYALISGICDIKTIQYYLFDKGIFFRSWYIKKHLKHIKIKEIKENKNKIITDKEIINKEINQIYSEIKELETLGEVADKRELENKRKLLMGIISEKNRLFIDETDDSNVINLEDLKKSIIFKK